MYIFYLGSSSRQYLLSTHMLYRKSILYIILGQSPSAVCFILGKVCVDKVKWPRLKKESAGHR